MLQLHVWGVNGEISLISPECLASAWLLSLILGPKNESFEIITSCNTNISDINKLPVLITPEKKLNGYKEIVSFVEKYQEESEYYVSSKGTPEKQLIHSCLLTLLESKIEIINQYNLYSNTKNYEKYTRKLFQHYFPFPMMYNQPLKFHNNAVAQVKLLGLDKNKTSFFDFTSAFQDTEVAETEYFNNELSDSEDEDEEGKDKVALSSLHEKQLLSKSKSKLALRESKNSLRCLILLNHYLQEFIKTYKLLNNQQDVDSEFGYLFTQNSPSSSELLLYAYLVSLTSENLPDRFISSYLELKHEGLMSFVNERITKLQKLLADNKSRFRPPQGIEVPNLFNEVGYLVGSIKY
ncbi:Sorting assembly machinery 37 kDa subunit [Spathaspora sp. JA1]|nr:Sorting assembly machinery 37 kDa subunit [Spathaspora sp. JA1]